MPVSCLKSCVCMHVYVCVCVCVCVCEEGQIWLELSPPNKEVQKIRFSFLVEGIWEASDKYNADLGFC